MSLEWLPGDKATKPCFSFTVLHFVFISCEFYFRNQNNTNNNNLKNFSSAISTLSISLLVYHKPVLYASGNTESVYELSTGFFLMWTKMASNCALKTKLGNFFQDFLSLGSATQRFWWTGFYMYNDYVNSLVQTCKYCINCIGMKFLSSDSMLFYSCPTVGLWLTKNVKQRHECFSQCISMFSF